MGGVDLTGIYRWCSFNKKNISMTKTKQNTEIAIISPWSFSTNWVTAKDILIHLS